MNILNEKEWEEIKQFRQTKKARLVIEYYEFLGGGDLINIKGAKRQGLDNDIVTLTLAIGNFEFELDLLKADIKAMGMAVSLID